jgi:hypothetical protein
VADAYVDLPSSPNFSLSHGLEEEEEEEVLQQPDADPSANMDPSRRTWSSLIDGIQQVVSGRSNNCTGRSGNRAQVMVASSNRSSGCKHKHPLILRESVRGERRCIQMEGDSVGSFRNG